MAKNRLGVSFDGFDEMVDKLTKLNGDVKKITERALKETHKHVTPTLHQEMSKHYATGETEQSIVDTAKVEWAGTVASVKVGFDISKGGLPSIFLMYGTPRMKKDTKLYNAIYGKKTQDEIKEIQENIFYEELRKLGG